MTDDATAPGPEPEQNETAAELAATTLGRDMLASMIGELKALPRSWADMTEVEQERVIGRLGVRVREIIRDALGILFAGDYPAVRAVVDAVQFKDGVKAVLKLSKTEHHRHELADAEGQAVVVIMAAPDEYFARMEEIKAKRQQTDLFDPATAGGYEGRSPRSSGEPEGPTQVGGDEHTLETLTLDMGPLWNQAFGMVQALAAQMDPQAIIEYGLGVPEDVAREWTDDECQRIAAWVLEVRKARDETAEDGVPLVIVACPVLVPGAGEVEPQGDLALEEPEGDGAHLADCQHEDPDDTGQCIHCGDVLVPLDDDDADGQPRPGGE